MKRKKLLTSIAVVVIAIIAIIIFLNIKSNGKEEIVVVTRQDLAETIEISGRVEAGTISNIGFDVSGTIRSVLVKVNDFVTIGQPLITLNLGTLLSELSSAKADLALKETSYTSNSSQGGTINQKQETLVESAYSKMLSDGLIAEPADNTQTVSAPLITGRYSGPEGVYKIIIISEQTDQYELRTFGLESTKDIEISKVSPTELGTKGLFIEFPESLENYPDTIWYVTIPNKKASSYTTNFNNYQEALREKDKESSSPVAIAEIAKARANVQKIETQISERTLRAPFAGTITSISADPGEAVGANEQIVTIISSDLGISVDLPEIDSVRVSVGDKVKIVFDALDSGEMFDGIISSVNRAETIVDGIPIYEARIILSDINEKIVSGMTAGVTITVNEKKNVLAIPAHAISTKGNKNYVILQKTNTKETEEKEVRIGMRSTDGLVEIISGLNEGDKILVSS